MQVLNGVDGPEANAENVRATLRAGDAPITVESGTIPLGALAAARSSTAAFDVVVDENAPAGTYDARLRLEYSYTAVTGSEINTVDTVDVEVRISDDARFDIVNANSTVAVDGSGEVAVDLEKRLGGDLRDVRVTASSPATGVQFDSPTRFVGAWNGDDAETVTFDATATAATPTRPVPVTVDVQYRDSNGIERQSRVLTTSIIPQEEHQFSVANTESTLRVDAEGQITGELVNDGPKTVTEAALVLQSSGTGVTTQSSGYAIGTLESGATQSFDFALEASEAAEAGPRQLEFVVNYRDDDGTRRASDVLIVQTDVAQQRDVFTVGATNGTVPVAGSSTVEVQVTNNGDDPLTNINTKAFVNSPLSIGADEVYVPSLAAGESTTIRYDLSAASGAVVRPQPLELDFQYQEPDGDTRLSDTYQVAVDLRPAEEESGLPLPLILGIVAVIAIIGGVVYRRVQ
ncbi:COG1361 S-layer family protein [Halosegnis longus]|uniref:COG1361 S-layer family protein n=1 Tax=Halosegnis longus TaxID=2216012 RepID=UPI0013149FE6